MVFRELQKFSVHSLFVWPSIDASYRETFNLQPYIILNIEYKAEVSYWIALDCVGETNKVAGLYMPTKSLAEV